MASQYNESTYLRVTDNDVPTGEDKQFTIGGRPVVFRLEHVVCTCCFILMMTIGLSIGLCYPHLNTNIDPVCNHGTQIVNSTLCECYSYYTTADNATQCNVQLYSKNLATVLQFWTGYVGGGFWYIGDYALAFLMCLLSFCAVCSWFVMYNNRISERLADSEAYSTRLCAIISNGVLGIAWIVTFILFCENNYTDFNKNRLV